MKRDELEQLMVSQLYGELANEDRQNLDAWLNSHPEDRSEYEALEQTCSLLNRLRAIDEIEGTVVEMLPPQRRSLKSWRGWMMAAACFAILFLCSTEGFVLQIGSFRVGVGSIAQSPDISNQTNELDVKEMIRQELTAHYLPTLDEIVKTIETVQISRDLMAQRQEALEQSLINLSAVQKIGERKMELALNELVDGLDQRLRPYLAAAQPAMYRAIPASN